MKSTPKYNAPEFETPLAELLTVNPMTHMLRKQGTYTHSTSTVSMDHGAVNDHPVMCLGLWTDWASNADLL